VDHAGLSLLSTLVKVTNSYNKELSDVSLLNNLILVILPEIWDVMVVGCILLYSTVLLMDSVPIHLIPMSLEMVQTQLADNPSAPWIPSESVVSKDSVVMLIFKTIACNNPYQ